MSKPGKAKTRLDGGTPAEAQSAKTGRFTPIELQTQVNRSTSPGAGTHRGDLNGLAPTDRTVTVTGMTLQRFAGGRVTEAWSNWDTLGLLQQIGAAPAPGGIAERIGVRFQRAATRVEKKVRSRS